MDQKPNDIKPKGLTAAVALLKSMSDEYRRNNPAPTCMDPPVKKYVIPVAHRDIMEQSMFEVFHEAFPYVPEEEMRRIVHAARMDVDSMEEFKLPEAQEGV